MPGDISGLVLARPPQPFAQISADCRNAIVPDTVDGGRKIVIVAGGSFLDHDVENLPYLVQVFRPNRQQVPGAQTLEQLELDVVNERSALERIELIDRLGHLAWPETVYGLKEKSVGAAG